MSSVNTPKPLASFSAIALSFTGMNLPRVFPKNSAPLLNVPTYGIKSAILLKAAPIPVLGTPVFTP